MQEPQRSHVPARHAGSIPWRQSRPYENAPSDTGAEWDLLRAADAVVGVTARDWSSTAGTPRSASD